MRSKLIADSPKTYALILGIGDEVFASLKGFSQAEKLAVKQLQGNRRESSGARLVRSGNEEIYDSAKIRAAGRALVAYSRHCSATPHQELLGLTVHLFTLYQV